MAESNTNPKVAELSASSTPTTVAANSPLRSKDVLLPLNRVRTIMKSSPDVEAIGQESLFLITKVKPSVGYYYWYIQFIQDPCHGL